MKIAVVGGGISGLSCAWLLSGHHDVWLYEKDDRFGGHSHTVWVKGRSGKIPVDTGFMVFNDRTYQNLCALLKYLDVPVQPAEFSCGISQNKNKIGYLATQPAGIFNHPINYFRPGCWKMWMDLLCTFKASHNWLNRLPSSMTLREWLQSRSTGHRFVADHLLPLGNVLWSISYAQLLDYSAVSFLRFFHSHGFFQPFYNRPQWLTIKGGSHVSVEKLRSRLAHKALDNCCVRKIRRSPGSVVIQDWQGQSREFDQVVLACHADTSLRLLSDPDDHEQRALGAFRFTRNRVVLSSDKRMMPGDRRMWAGWNVQADSPSQNQNQNQNVSVTYWLNRLQNINDNPLFLTLNPSIEPETSSIRSCSLDDHPVLDHESFEAQQLCWKLQGRRRTWFCGAWLGYGFHEDGLQSGLAVAEKLGGLRRPWEIANDNDRLTLPDDWC